MHNRRRSWWSISKPSSSLAHPAIDQGAVAVANARRLIDAAAMLRVPTLSTEQNAGGLGPNLAPDPAVLVHKMTFDACREPDFLRRLAKHHAIVVAGCEAHVCVLQTVLGLIDNGRRVFLMRDALGSRRAESKRLRSVGWSAMGRRSSPLRWSCSNG